MGILVFEFNKFVKRIIFEMCRDWMEKGMKIWSMGEIKVAWRKYSIFDPFNFLSNN